MRFFKRALEIVKEAAKGWSEHRAPHLGAALAYYTIFSIGPLLLIAIAVAGAVFGKDAAANRVYATLNDHIGNSGALVVQQAVEGASHPVGSIFATIAGIVVLIVGATGVFGELHDSLNMIWGVHLRKGGGIKRFFRERFLSFTMVLGVGFLLLTSLVLTAALAALGNFVRGGLPGGELVWQLINFVVGLAMVTFLFALIFRFVPDVRVPWRPVLIAGLVTSLLFSIGKLALGIYIGKASVGSSFGAASSVIVILVWVYYTAHILYFGAELARSLAVHLRVRIRPIRGAVEVCPVVEEDESCVTAPQGGVPA